MNPLDTPASATLRFLVELAAWIAGPWAVADLTGTGWLAVPAVLVLVGAVSVFSTPGDKNQVVIATPGPIRLIIELALTVVAVGAAWVVWPLWAAVVVTAIAAAAQVTGWQRTRWLAIGAPPFPDQGR